MYCIINVYFFDNIRWFFVGFWCDNFQKITLHTIHTAAEIIQHAQYIDNYLDMCT